MLISDEDEDEEDDGSGGYITAFSKSRSRSVRRRKEGSLLHSRIAAASGRF